MELVAIVIISVYLFWIILASASSFSFRDNHFVWSSHAEWNIWLTIYEIKDRTKLINIGIKKNYQLPMEHYTLILWLWGKSQAVVPRRSTGALLPKAEYCAQKFARTSPSSIKGQQLTVSQESNWISVILPYSLVLSYTCSNNQEN